MKFNWGYGIAMVCVGFALFISFMVYKASQQKIEFVTDNYYDKELKFQEQIDKQKNSLALSEKVFLKYDPAAELIRIKYPASFDPQLISGSITFFKPDNSSLDFNVRVSSDENHLQEFPSGKMQKGWWIVKINWSASGTGYYYEEKILVS